MKFLSVSALFNCVHHNIFGSHERKFSHNSLVNNLVINDKSVCNIEHDIEDCVNGKESFRPGEAKNSWLTGTAAWNFHAVSQSILGVKPELDGLRIDPCLPTHLRTVHIHRVFRGNVYEISIENRAGGEKGAVSVRLDGKALPGQLIPAPEGEGKTFRVEVTVD